jgi:hypothetical protein
VDEAHGFMWVVVRVLLAAVLALLAGASTARGLRGLVEWMHNNSQPKLTAEARLIARRAEVSSGYTLGITWTWYYATFELDNGVRAEFCLPGREFGLLAEGDLGLLSFQGTRYHGFQRKSL